VVVLCATMVGCYGGGPTPGAPGNDAKVDVFGGEWVSLTGSYEVSQCGIERLDRLSTSSLRVRIPSSTSTTRNIELVYQRDKGSCLVVGKAGTQFIADGGQICDLGYEAFEVVSLFMDVQAEDGRGQINILGGGTIEHCIHRLTGNLAKDQGDTP